MSSFSFFKKNGRQETIKNFALCQQTERYDDFADGSSFKKTPSAQTTRVTAIKERCQMNVILVAFFIGTPLLILRKKY